ncbi:MAG: D-glycero-beta-D-manno-heptose 1,7-bisphosphate 7-phosphatase [Gammaproteobacteria bacterium]|nr:D-glycero-beta-D-manno-heptose 1,7-bisphosphate 7-phosphatase [Gammaproteobacteria bacterium]
MKLIILDRDGVINQDSDDYIKSVEEFIPIPGSLEAIGKLTRAGYTVTVATNQSGIAHGYYSRATLTAMHDKLIRLLQVHGGGIDRFFICPHGPDDQCICRKPKPGLFAQIADHYRQPLAGVPSIGDSWRDIQAGSTFGVRAMLVQTGKGARALAQHADDLKAIPVYQNLSHAVNTLLAEDITAC